MPYLVLQLHYLIVLSVELHMLVLYDFEKLLDVVVLLLHESLRTGREGGGLWLEAAHLRRGTAPITLAMGPVLRDTNHLTWPFLFQRLACFAFEGADLFASEVNTHYFLRETTGSFVDLSCCCYFPSIFASRTIMFCEVGP